MPDNPYEVGESWKTTKASHSTLINCVSYLLTLIWFCIFLLYCLGVYYAVFVDKETNYPESIFAYIFWLISCYLVWACVKKKLVNKKLIIFSTAGHISFGIYYLLKTENSKLISFMPYFSIAFLLVLTYLFLVKANKNRIHKTFKS
jgi:hypothetical protein